MGFSSVVASTIVYGCCVGSWSKFCDYVEPKVHDREIIALAGQTSIASAYNKILSACRGRDVDMLVLVHDDLEITDLHAEEKLLAALADETVGLVGVAGGAKISSLAWWAFETYGSQRIDDQMTLDLGPLHGDVDHVEGSFMAVGPWFIENAQFDETCPAAWHGYDEIGSQVRAAGKRVIVTDVSTFHHTQIGFSSSESANAWYDANAWFKEKWGHV